MQKRTAMRAIAMLVSVELVFACFVPMPMLREAQAQVDGEQAADSRSSAKEESPEEESFSIPEGVEYEPDEMIVVVSTDASTEEVEEALAQVPDVSSSSVEEEQLASGIVTVPLEPGTSVEDAVNDTLEAAPGVIVGCQPNYIYHLMDAEDVVDLEETDDEEPIVDVGPVDEVDSAVEPNETAASQAGVQPIDAGGDERSDAGLMDVSPTLQAADDSTNESVNDPSAASQWALKSVRAYDAWSISRCEGSVAVAVLDTGFQLDHEDLVDNIIPGSAYNAHAANTGQGSTDDLTPPSKNYNHGTHVAGTIGAVANNGKGVAGVSYNAKLVPVKVFNDDGEATTASVVMGYDYVLGRAESDNIRVINLSVGAKYHTDSFSDSVLIGKVRQAYERGIVTVAAACNSNSSTGDAPFYAYPSDDESIVSVMNLRGTQVDEGDDASGAYDVELGTTSNYNVSGQGGEHTHKGKNISAPGTSILSTINNNLYGSSTGTSNATPVVAGVLALEFAANSSLTADEAVDILYHSAHDIGDAGWDEKYGHGEVDAYAAVRMAQSGAVQADANGLGEVSMRLNVPDGGLVYDRSAKEPDVEVMLEDAQGVVTTLVRDVDFEVTYANNVESGMMSATVAGIGSYAGAFCETLHATIGRRQLTANMVTLSSSVWDYDARPVRPAVTKVKDGDVTLVEDVDYEGSVTYSHNQDAGTGFAVVAGMGNYEGEAVKEFTILPRSVNYSKVTLELDEESFTYDGKEHKPGVTLRHERKTAVSGELIYELEEGKDYTLAYEDNVNVGTGKVVITGIGNYKDVRIATFTIEPPASDPIPEPSFVRQNLVLTGQIGLTVFVDLPETDRIDWSQSKMAFHVGHAGSRRERDVEVPFDANFRDSTKKYYGFTVPVSSVEMAEPVTATLHYGDGLTLTKEGISVKRYVEGFEDSASSFDDDTVSLVHAVADYGHWVQPFLSASNHWSLGDGEGQYMAMDTFYASGYDSSAVASVLGDHVLSAEIEGTSVTATSASLVLESETSLDFVLTTVDGVKPTITTATLGGKSVPASKLSVTRVGSRWRVRIAGIRGWQLADPIVVTGDCGGEFVLKGSGYAYVKLLLGAEAHAQDGGHDAACALVAYAQAELAYRAAHP